jgi:biopolymer transport protein ExbD
VLLLADRDAAVERAVLLLSQAQAAGYPSVAIATKPPEGAAP